MTFNKDNYVMQRAFDAIWDAMSATIQARGTDPDTANQVYDDLSRCYQLYRDWLDAHQE